LPTIKQANDGRDLSVSKREPEVPGDLSKIHVGEFGRGPIERQVEGEGKRAFRWSEPKRPRGLDCRGLVDLARTQCREKGATLLCLQRVQFGLLQKAEGNQGSRFL